MNALSGNLVVSMTQLVFASLRYFLFDCSAKRQAARIRVRLFGAILERVRLLPFVSRWISPLLLSGHLLLR